MPLHPDTAALVEALDLAPHPEGGFYRETFRGGRVLREGGGARAASTAIYFLLPAGSFSAWHAVDADEAWHFYGGAPLALHQLDPDGRYSRMVLGSDLAAGQRPQAVVPAGALQAAEPLGEPHALCGCTVAPGFEFAGFSLPSRGELLARFDGRPDVHEILRRLSRE